MIYSNIDLASELFLCHFAVQVIHCMECHSRILAVMHGLQSTPHVSTIYKIPQGTRYTLGIENCAPEPESMDHLVN